MMSSASTPMKKNTHATKSSICPNGNFNTSRSGRKAPIMLISILAVILALCATTQVLCSRLNKTIIPPLTLSFDDALEYLVHTSNKHLDEKYSALYDSNSTSSSSSEDASAHYLLINGSVRSYGFNITNTFLNYFFEEIDNSQEENN